MLLLVVRKMASPALLIELKETVFIKQTDVIQCSKCEIAFGREYFFTQKMFDSPCFECGGKWLIRLQSETKKKKKLKFIK